MSEKKLFKRLHALLDRLEQLLPAPAQAVDWSCLAYRWHAGQLIGIKQPHWCEWNDLLGVDRQKQEVLRNTEQFLAARAFNHVLLWGARGTGKSTLIKALLSRFAQQGLRLVEVEAQELRQLPQIAEILGQRSERFLLYCDDLSFEADDPSYKALKAILEGSIVAAPSNLMICATSNRRHLLPEYQQENQQTSYVGDEVHPGESIEEKVSLSERFGLWLSFYPFNQDQYLAICAHWLRRLGDVSANDIDKEPWRHAAVQWASQRGSRSGRVARQFAVDWLGRCG